MNAAVEELFHQAAGLPPPARARYVADHHVDEDTRREIEALLAFEAAASAALMHGVSVGPAARCRRSKRARELFRAKKYPEVVTVLEALKILGVHG